MIAQISKHILDKAADSAEIEPEMYDVYQYGIEITISSILNVVLILIFGLVVGDIAAALCFLAYMIPLRQFCGGYHASTYFRCNSIFILAFLANFYAASKIAEFNLSLNYLEAVILLSLIPIIIYAPVNNPHKKLDKQKRNKCRVISIILSVAMSVISVLVCAVSLFYGSLLIVAQVIIAVMIIFEIILQRRGIHET